MYLGQVQGQYLGDGRYKFSVYSHAANYFFLQLEGLYDWATVENPDGEKSRFDRSISWVGIQNAPAGSFTVTACNLQIKSEWKSTTGPLLRLVYVEIPHKTGFSLITPTEYEFIRSDRFKQQYGYNTDGILAVIQETRERGLTVSAAEMTPRELMMNHSGCSFWLAKATANDIMQNGVAETRNSWDQSFPSAGAPVPSAKALVQAEPCPVETETATSACILI